MRCYVCQDPVSKSEHEKTSRILEDDDPDDENSITNILGLVHCRGDDDEFDADGNVVVCRGCIDRSRKLTPGEA